MGITKYSFQKSTEESRQMTKELDILITFLRLNTLLFHVIYISVQVNLKSHSLFSTGAVSNKANALSKKDVIKEMKFTTNVWASLVENTLSLLKIY